MNKEKVKLESSFDGAHQNRMVRVLDLAAKDQNLALEMLDHELSLTKLKGNKVIMKKVVESKKDAKAEQSTDEVTMRKMKKHKEKKESNYVMFYKA